MITTDTAMLHPLFAMVALTFAVGVRMYLARVAEMKRRRIHPQQVATRARAAAELKDTRAADNFSNLFELPVLFYPAVLLAWLAGLADPVYLALAWLFVASRVIHSLVQVSYNRVMHRFLAFITGFVLLAVIWIRLAVDLL